MLFVFVRADPTCFDTIIIVSHWGRLGTPKARGVRARQPRIAHSIHSTRSGWFTYDPSTIFVEVALYEYVLSETRRGTRIEVHSRECATKFGHSHRIFVLAVVVSVTNMYLFHAS